MNITTTDFARLEAILKGLGAPEEFITVDNIELLLRRISFEAETETIDEDGNVFVKSNDPVQACIDAVFTYLKKLVNQQYAKENKPTKI